MTYLVYLNLTNNSISQIQAHSFNCLFYLKNLTLRDYQIVTLQQGTFNGLSSLPTLDLNAIKLAIIEDCAFCYTNQLLKVNLSYNQISSLHREMFKGVE